MDNLSPKRRSENMRRIRSKNTKPELFIRSVVHKLGYRFRLHRKDLPGSPDLVFPARKKVIFIHGCFWHQHPKHDCLDSKVPKSNTVYWKPKLERNTQRDAECQLELTKLGWQPMTIWECELKRTDALEKKIIKFLDYDYPDSLDSAQQHQITYDPKAQSLR